MTNNHITKENMKERNPNQPQVLVIGGSGSGKTNALFILIKQQNDDDYNIIDRIYLYVQDPNGANIDTFFKNMKKLVQRAWRSKGSCWIFK